MNARRLSILFSALPCSSACLQLGSPAVSPAFRPPKFFSASAYLIVCLAACPLVGTLSLGLLARAPTCQPSCQRTLAADSNFDVEG